MLYFVNLRFDKIQDGLIIIRKFNRRKKMINRFIPEGVSDLGYTEFENKKAVEDALAESFRKDGYRQVMTPTFEYFDLFSDDTIASGTEEMYKIVDKNGQLMVLRPDATIPIARMAAGYCREGESLKLMYITNVYRTADFKKGEKREFKQAGIEYFGSADTSTDAGVIRTAIAALKGIVGDDLKAEIGNAGYFNGFIEAVKNSGSYSDSDLYFSKEDELKVRELVESKNIPGLTEFADKHELDADMRKVLLAMPMLFGDSEETIAKAESLALNDSMKKACEDVRKICAILKEESIYVDMGLVSMLEYYSGVIFKLYLKTSGMIVGSGGRYDKLMKKFGANIPAVGVGINVDTLAEARENAAASKDSDDILTIALGKGRLADITFKKFEEAGITFPEYTKESRKLIFEDSTGRFRIIFVKAVDVGIYVEKGACDVGVIGKDTLMESGSDVFEMMDLGYGKCMFAVAAPHGYRYDFSRKLRVASKYPKVAKEHFARIGKSIEITKINGSVELAPIVGLSDVIVDIVETGNTLRENGLEVVEKVADISARFIVNRASLKTRQKRVLEIMSALENQF